MLYDEDTYRDAFWKSEYREDQIESGKRDLFLVLLQHKFGRVKKKVKTRVGNAGSARILRWATRLLGDASSLEEVFAPRRPARTKLEQNREFFVLLLRRYYRGVPKKIEARVMQASGGELLRWYDGLYFSHKVEDVIPLTPEPPTPAPASGPAEGREAP